MKFEDDLVKVEQGYPEEWHGSFLNYRLLKGLIKKCKNSGSCEDSGDNEDFFEKLSEEMQRINKTFNQVTLSTLKAYKTIKNEKLFGFCCFLWGGSKVRLPNGRSVRANSQNVATIARLCIEYSKVNALALRKISKKFDKQCSSRKGQQARSKFWFDQTGDSSFLHSPLLIELAAIEFAYVGSTHGSERPLEEGDHNSPNRNVPMAPFPSNGEESSNFCLEEPQCPICLDIPFKPIALACGHIFCQSCLFKACGRDRTLGTPRAILDSIGKESCCPQCRQVDVFSKSVILTATSIHIETKYPLHWAERSAEEVKCLRKLEEEYKKTQAAKLKELRGFHPAYLLYT